MNIRTFSVIFFGILLSYHSYGLSSTLSQHPAAPELSACNKLLNQGLEYLKTNELLGIALLGKAIDTATKNSTDQAIAQDATSMLEQHLAEKSEQIEFLTTLYKTTKNSLPLQSVFPAELFEIMLNSITTNEEIIKRNILDPGENKTRCLRLKVNFCSLVTSWAYILCVKTAADDTRQLPALQKINTFLAKSAKFLDAPDIISENFDLLTKNFFCACIAMSQAALQIENPNEELPAHTDKVVASLINIVTILEASSYNSPTLTDLFNITSRSGLLSAMQSIKDKANSNTLVKIRKVHHKAKKTISAPPTIVIEKHPDALSSEDCTALAENFFTNDEKTDTKYQERRASLSGLIEACCNAIEQKPFQDLLIKIKTWTHDNPSPKSYLQKILDVKDWHAFNATTGHQAPQAAEVARRIDKELTQFFEQLDAEKDITFDDERMAKDIEIAIDNTQDQELKAVLLLSLARLFLLGSILASNFEHHEFLLMESNKAFALLEKNASLPLHALPKLEDFKKRTALILLKMPAMRINLCVNALFDLFNREQDSCSNGKIFSEELANYLNTQAKKFSQESTEALYKAQDPQLQLILSLCLGRILMLGSVIGCNNQNILFNNARDFLNMLELHKAELPKALHQTFNDFVQNMANTQNKLELAGIIPAQALETPKSADLSTSQNQLPESEATKTAAFCMSLDLDSLFEKLDTKQNIDYSALGLIFEKIKSLMGSPQDEEANLLLKLCTGRMLLLSSCVLPDVTQQVSMFTNAQDLLNKLQTCKANLTPTLLHIFEDFEKRMIKCLSQRTSIITPSELPVTISAKIEPLSVQEPTQKNKKTLKKNKHKPIDLVPSVASLSEDMAQPSFKSHDEQFKATHPKKTPTSSAQRSPEAIKTAAFFMSCDLDAFFEKLDTKQDINPSDLQSIFKRIKSLLSSSPDEESFLIVKLCIGRASLLSSCILSDVTQQALMFADAQEELIELQNHKTNLTSTILPIFEDFEKRMTQCLSQRTATITPSELPAPISASVAPPVKKPVPTPESTASLKAQPNDKAPASDTPSRKKGGKKRHPVPADSTITPAPPQSTQVSDNADSNIEKLNVNLAKLQLDNVHAAIPQSRSQAPVQNPAPAAIKDPESVPAKAEPLSINKQTPTSQDKKTTHKPTDQVTSVASLSEDMAQLRLKPHDEKSEASHQEKAAHPTPEITLQTRPEELPEAMLTCHEITYTDKEPFSIHAKNHDSFNSKNEDTEIKKLKAKRPSGELAKIREFILSELVWYFHPGTTDAERMLLARELNNDFDFTACDIKESELLYLKITKEALAYIFHSQACYKLNFINSMIRDIKNSTDPSSVVISFLGVQVDFINNTRVMYLCAEIWRRAFSIGLFLSAAQSLAPQGPAHNFLKSLESQCPKSSQNIIMKSIRQGLDEARLHNPNKLEEMLVHADKDLFDYQAPKCFLDKIRNPFSLRKT
jgi:hypothetical protein